MWAITCNNSNCKSESQATTLKFLFWFIYLLWNPLLTECSGEEIYLTIPALGRTAQLGYMYDAVKDEIIEMSIFRDNTVNDSLFVKRTQTPGYNNDFDVTSTFADKIRLSKINLNDAVNILSGLTEPEGSFRFLTDLKNIPGQFTGVFLYKYKSLVEDLQIFSDHVKDLYYKKVLLNKRATHIVTSITRGANVAVTLDFDVENNNNDLHHSHSWNEIQKSALRKKLKTAGRLISGGNSTSENHFLFSVYADISPKTIINLKYTSANEVQEILKEMPQLIQGINGGKGVPIKIKLTPISILRKHLELKIENEQFLHPLNDWILRDILAIIDEISFSKMYLNSLVEKFNSQVNSFISEQISTFDRLQLELGNFENNFKYNLQDSLIQVRSGGEISENILSNLTQNYYTGELSLPKIREAISEFTGSIEAIEYCKTLRDNFPSVECFDYTKNLNQQILQQIPNKPIYMLYTKSRFIKEQSMEYQKAAAIFFHTLNKPYNTLFFISCDFPHPHCESLNRTVIKQFKNGLVTYHDVEKEILRTSMLKSLHKAAIGRHAQMGQLYDARTDSFLETSLLSPSLQQKQRSSTVVTTTLNWTEAIDIASNNYADKLKAMRIDSELQFSILAGLVPLTGDALYLKSKEDLQSFRLVHHFNGSELDISKAIEQDVFKLHLLQDTRISGSATHFVSKVFYGSSTVFSFRENKTTNSDTLLHKSTGKFACELAKSFKKAIGGDNAPLLEIGKQLEEDALKIIAYSNIPQNIGSCNPLEIVSGRELLDFMINEFPENSEVPIAYVMYPIENLRDFGIVRETVPFTTLSSTDEDPADFADIFNQIEGANEDFQLMSLQMKQNLEGITDNDLKSLSSMKESFINKTVNFKENFKTTVVQIRSGAMQPTELRKFKQAFIDQNNIGEDGKWNELKKMSKVAKKIKFLNRISNSENIKYIGREPTQLSIDEIFMEKNGKFFNIYILHYKPEWTEEKDKVDDWHRVTQLFFGPLSSGEDSMERKLYVVNCEFDLLHCGNVTHPTIHEYRQGKLVSMDFINSTDDDETHLKKQFQKLNSTAGKMSQEIETLVAGLRNVSSQITENRNTIQDISTQVNSCENENKIMGVISNANDVRILGCGGLVNLPLSGSVFLRYKFNGSQGEEQRCLWTLNMNHNEKNYLHKLRTSLVCDKLGSSNNSLTFHEWYPYDSDTDITFFDLRTNTGQLHPSSSILRHFVYFNSKSVFARAEFIVKVDVLSMQEWFTELNWSFDTIPGRVDCDQYKRYESTSIVVGTPQTQTVQFIVEKMDFSVLCGIYSDRRDQLEVYELGERGKPRLLRRLCGKVKNPISFSTQFPVIVLFQRYASSTDGTFSVSWK